MHACKRYFQFRQFGLCHDNSAMKVGTDGVLIGAWARVEGTQSVLDIGTGCGLIAMMLAQRCHASIDAVEIDNAACEDAARNFQECPWHGRLTLYHTSIQAYRESVTKKYDLVVSNPPFFARSLLPINPQKAVARHTQTLSPEELTDIAASFLNPDGRLALVIPQATFKAMAGLQRMADLHLQRVDYISSQEGKPANRVLLEAGFKRLPLHESVWAIAKGLNKGYTQQYQDLTGEFYLERVFNDT